MSGERRDTRGIAVEFPILQLLISFCKQVIFWFSSGTDDIKRMIVTTAGSNFFLTDKKLRYEAKRPFMLKAEEPQFLSTWAFVADIRTRFESQDPDFLKLLEEVRNVKATVESVAQMAPPRLSARGAREARRGSGVRGISASRRRKRPVPRTGPPSAAGTSQLSRRE